MGIKLIKKNNENTVPKVVTRALEFRGDESNANESIGAVIRNGGNRYKESFMIDCGTPENALALADAMTDEAYGHPAGGELDDAGRHFLGGELIQCWPVGHFFTASVDPCEKAIAWCRDFLRNLGGSAPGIQGNDAGLESKGEGVEMDLESLKKKVTAFLDSHPGFIDGIGYEALMDAIGVKDWADTGLSNADFNTLVDDAIEGEGYHYEDAYLVEDRRGTDRYGHSVKRFTTKDLKDLDGEVIGGNADDAGTPDKFGLAYLDTVGIDAFSNNHSTAARDKFLHDLAQMPVSKKSIEDLLRKHELHRWGRTIGIRDFFPENGIAYLGTPGPDGLPYKSLVLKWGPALKKS